jgi:glyoxylase I family protein
MLRRAGGAARVQVHGIGYPAIICRDLDETISFYERALGMRPLFMEPNRDDAESVQVLLDAGSGTRLLLVGPVDPKMKLAEAQLGVGSMQYLSLRVSGADLDAAYHSLANAGVQASEEIRRGYERLIFLEDPSGVLITLTAWTREPPPGADEVAILRRAAEIRDAAGTPFVEDEHLAQAIEESRA